MDQKLIVEFISTFRFLANFDCFPAIEEMFQKLIEADWSTETIDTNKHLIVTFCRGNCKWKGKLQNYEEFVDKSVEYLEEHGIKPESLLKGII